MIFYSQRTAPINAVVFTVCAIQIIADFKNYQNLQETVALNSLGAIGVML